MRATIIVPDNYVSVDSRKFRSVDCAELAAKGVHAVQWYGDYGEIEYVTEFDRESMTYRRAPNEIIVDVDYIEPYLAAWEALNSRLEPEEKAQAEELARSTAEVLANTERQREA